MGKTVALRTALIWHDEVMDDVVLEKPAAITLGSTGKPTFVVPEIGLPQAFAIVRPGNRGYLLTLGEHMRGTICIDGKKRDVAELVASGSSELAGGFYATPIAGNDWGVVELDASGHCKLFFQFVPVEDAQPFFTPQVLLAGAGGFALSTLALAAVFLVKGVHVDYLLFDSELAMKIAEAAFRGAALSSAVLAISGLFWWITRQDGDSQTSLGFSVLLHAALLFMTYQLYDGQDPFSWPGPRDLTANYLATRLEPEPKPEPQKPTVGQKAQTAAAPGPKSKPAVTKNTEGAAGGEGKKERAHDPNAKDAPPTPPKAGFFEDKNQKLLNQVTQNLQTGLNKFAAIPGDRNPGDLGYGPGHGSGLGQGNGSGTTRGSNGHGPGGGGHANGDYISVKGDVDSGGNRPGGGNCAKPPCGTGMHEVNVALSTPDGDFGGLTAEEINRVIKARKGLIRSCYQKELNRNPGLGGKIVMHFVIDGEGVVKSAKTAGGSTMRNDDVETCVSRAIMTARFPAKGGLATVNYPFVFEPGGG